jgi:TM2 domain-containing membrane protein YozV
MKNKKNIHFSFHSGQFGKAWTPTLGVWGIGVGTAALFVRAYQNHNAQHLFN